MLSIWGAKLTVSDMPSCVTRWYVYVVYIVSNQSQPAKHSWLFKIKTVNRETQRHEDKITTPTLTRPIGIGTPNLFITLVPKAYVFLGFVPRLALGSWLVSPYLVILAQ